MGQIIFRDFSAGWCPSDDPVNGRKNGFLKMDNLELDRNGTLSMSGGIQTLFTYPADAHSIYSVFLNGIRTRYLAMQETSIARVYRNGGLIASSTEVVIRAGFGVAYSYVLITSGTLRIKDNGTTFTNLGLNTPLLPVVLASGGAGDLSGDLEYIQIGVFIDGNGYIGKSAASPIATITVDAEFVSITPSAPSTIDAQANQTWIYRRGGNLDKFYRVAIRFDGSTFLDGLGEEDAIIINETLNTRVVPTSSVGIPEPILEIVGPINGRHLYFTKSKVYFSEINSPDSTDPNVAMNVTGSSAELFLWARKLGASIVVIGTTQDLYLLSGTFVQLPDGFLDVSLLPMGVDNPPISIDVAVTSSADANVGGTLVYMSTIGWVAASAQGNTTLLSDARVDRLYKGNSTPGYGGVPIYLHPTLRYSCCIAKDKLWVRIPQIVSNNPALPFTYRMESYDFKRQYWRPLPYSPSILFAEPDSNVMGFFPADHTLCDVDNPFFKTNKGVKQTVDVITMYNDDSAPSNNKDPLSLKIRANTGGDPVTVTAFIDGTTSINLGTFTSSLLADSYISVLNVIPAFKTVEFRLQGTCADFILNEIVLEYSPRPVSVIGHRLKFSYGPNKKRARVWPLILDPLGGNVTFVPIVDGNLQVASTFSGNGKETFLHFFKTDVFGVDYEGVLTSTTPFEVWEAGPPTFVESLPIAKQFDQFGPLELFRYGKLKYIEIRVIPYGGTDIPYALIFEDDQVLTGSISALDSKETVQNIVLPKTTAGTVLRIELGPTAFNFHVLDFRILASRAGKDTEEEWIPMSKLMGAVNGA